MFTKLKRWAKGVVGQICPLDEFVTPPTPRPQEAPSAALPGRVRPSGPSAFILSNGSNDRCATGSEVRWNRRRHMCGAFDRLLGIGVGLAPATYRDFVDQRA